MPIYVNRRHVLGAFAATIALPRASLASEFVPYAPGLIEDALANGQTVFVDYSATWCGTCRRQGRVINALRSENAAYDAAMTFVKVDWDTYKDHMVTQSRNIPRRSTLLVLRGDAELGRIVAGTSRGDIQSLMDAGL